MCVCMCVCVCVCLRAMNLDMDTYAHACTSQKLQQKSVEDMSKRYDQHEDLGMFALLKNCSESPWRICQNTMTNMKN